jgi:polyisoprenoid-binding protein YceI
MSKMQTMSKLILLTAAILCIGNGLTAQSLKINSKSSTMTIYGTTNVHDFTQKVNQISGELVVNAAQKSIQSLDVLIPVRAIKSPEKQMDTYTYEAFNSEKNPNITFHLTEASGLKVTDKEIDVTVTGNLTINGTAKKISFKVNGKNPKSGVYQFKGAISLKMTEFKMKPPTAMMGMMKVGDGITLKFDITLEGAQIN